MKIRDSSMPDQGMWEGFFPPSRILETLEFNSGVHDAVEFGCGYGTFTISAAKMISGKLFAFDIEPEMVEATKKAAVDQPRTIMTKCSWLLMRKTGTLRQRLPYSARFRPRMPFVSIIAEYGRFPRTTLMCVNWFP